MAVHGTVNIYSADGASVILQIATENSRVCTIQIIESGFNFTKTYEGTITQQENWAYIGSKKFVGLSKTMGATMPDAGLAVGDTYTFANMESGSYYIVEEEIKVPTLTVTYNNTTIASIVEGESVTLNCAGHKMKSGITVTVPEIVADIVEEWDGSFVLEEYSPVSLISFTISDTEYQAVEGMTWREWVNSEYNADGYYIYIEQYVNSNSGLQVSKTNHHDYSVNEADVITADYGYFLVMSGGSN